MVALEMNAAPLDGGSNEGGKSARCTQEFCCVLGPT